MASNVWRVGGTAAGLVVGGAALMYAVIVRLPATALLSALIIGGLGIALVASAARPAQRPQDSGDASLRERARLALQAMLDQSPTPLLLSDGTSLTALNRAARQLFGVDDRLHAPSPALVAAIESGTSATITTNGQVRSFAVAISDIEGFGRMASLVDIASDLRMAEAAASRELMLVLSHEIMNGMTPIASMAQTAIELAEEHSVPPALLEAVGTIARRAEALASFSASYRDLARLPAPQRVMIPAQGLVADLSRLFAARWSSEAVDLRTKVLPSDLWLYVDGGQLSSALWAMLQNAVEAHAEAHIRDAPICLEVRSEIGQIRIIVADAGFGVKEPDRERVFRPFFTTRASGSGVGLALARQVFRAHGGDLILAQRDGEGATFIGSLPSM